MVAGSPSRPSASTTSGDYALVRAVSDALSAASRDIDAEAAEVLHQALTAEQGLH